MVTTLFLLRWLHFFFGIIWIGLLYYFNFVQGEWFKEADGGTKNQAISKLVPRALWWFRWAAMVTFLTGFITYLIYGAQDKALFLETSRGIFISVGALLGTLMFLNVWFVIWPNQKKVIASATSVVGGGQPDPLAAASGAKAALTSRTNVLFSIPMLFFMAAASHLPLETTPEANRSMMWIGILVLIGALQVNAIKGKMGILTSVKGVIHAGFGLTAILYAVVAVLA